MATTSMGKDLRRDWRRWSRAERVTVTLLGTVLALALPAVLVIAAP